MMIGFIFRNVLGLFGRHTWLIGGFFVVRYLLKTYKVRLDLPKLAAFVKEHEKAINKALPDLMIILKKLLAGK